MTNNAFIQAIHFLAYALLQVILFRNLILFDQAFCFVYVAFLLLMPIDTNRVILMLAGFLMGLFVDIFYDTLGIHAAASVFLMYLRPYWLKVVYGSDQNDLLDMPVLRNLGWQTFTVYVFPLILLHHTALFFIETGGFHLFFFTAGKVVLSGLLTYIVILIFQYMFYQERRAI